MTKDEALRLALEALESGEKMQNGRLVWIEHDISLVKQAITAIKAALEAKDEPVAWRYDQAKYRTNDLRGRQWAFNVFSQARPYMDEMVQNVTPLYTTPPQSLLLTDEPIENAIHAWFKPNNDGTYGTWHERMRAAIKAAIKEEKNT